MTTKGEGAGAVRVYPSPANDVIRVSLPDDAVPATSLIQVLSLEGKVLESKTSVGIKVVQLQVDRLVPGNYLIRINYGDRASSHAVTISR